MPSQRCPGSSRAGRRRGEAVRNKRGVVAKPDKAAFVVPCASVLREFFSAGDMDARASLNRPRFGRVSGVPESVGHVSGA
eukprot:10807574-Lingulodinium_polyedra.AAC.1